MFVVYVIMIIEIILCDVIDIVGFFLRVIGFRIINLLR